MKATFFGGAVNDTTTPEYKDSIEIGKILAKYNYEIKNGGYRGLMEAVSLGASSIENSIITGHTVKSFGSIKGNKYLTNTIVCEDIYERLKYLIEDTDIFLVQRGGIGTLSELFLVLDITRKMKNKPLVILYGNIWNNYYIFMQSLNLTTDNVLVLSTLNRFEDIIKNYKNENS